MNKMRIKKLRITQTKSKYGRLVKHKNCLSGLGIRKINNSVIVDGTPENLGMINKVSYMLNVEEI
jgi:large subunit ribosomal protein L30